MNKREIIEKFPDLKPEEVRQLCYIAYYGEDFGSAIPQYLKAFHKSRRAYDETVYKLLQTGYLLNHNTVTPDRHLDILDFLAVDQKEWLNTFKEFRHYSPTHRCEYLWRFAELLRKDDFVGASKLTKPYEGLSKKHINLYAYIRNRVVKDARYATLLDDDQIYLMTAESLEEMFKQGSLDEQTLNTIRQIPSSRHTKYNDIVDRVDLYKLFVIGEYPLIENPQTLWAFSICAIKELYAGNVEDSLAFFREAVKTQGAKIKSLPIPLLNYFFALCIIKYRLKYGPLAIQDELKNLRGSHLVKIDNNHFAARLLLEYAEAATENASNDVQRRVNMIKGYANDPINCCFAVLLANFFSLSEGLETLEGANSSILIMMHELSPYKAMSSKSKGELEALFGGKPILASIRRRSSWEILLGEIGTTVEKKIDNRPRRIIYFMKGKSLSSIMEQVQQEDSSWSDGRLLSVKTLSKEGYESMDVHDSCIAMGLVNKELWQTDADVIVPNLVNTGRLFCGVEYLAERMQANILQEPAYIEFNGKGEQIEILSNVKVAPDGLPSKYTIINQGTTYTIVTLNPLQRDILSKLLRQKVLPASAAPSLRKTIESLNGILEVRENILSDIEMMAFESDGHLAIRIEPVKVNLATEYRMTLLAMPLLNGITRIVPAVGDEYVYDEDESGRTHCVHRNMQQEEDNYQGIVDYAAQFNLEFSSYNVCMIGDERVLLNFLAFCHRNQDKYVVEWPNGQILKFKGILTDRNIDIEVKSDTEWFAVEGSAKIGVDVFNLDQLIKACCNDSYDGFVRIGENEYIKMTETLRRHIAELDAILTTGDRKQKVVPKYLVGILANRLEQMNQKVDSGYREFRDKMKMAYEKDIKIPDGLQATLRPYQEDGFKWISRLDEWGAGACLADDMGLGKTLQAITFLLSKADKGASLVIGPKSVIPNWVNEIKRFAPQLKVIVLNDAINRELAIEESDANMLILCTYGVLTTEAKHLSAKKWNVVCLDEAHNIKNRNTLVSHAAMDLVANSRIILTGTPLQNHVGELWNLMQFINPGLLGRWNIFRDTYVNATLDQDHRDMLKEMTQPFILRRTKQQVLNDLPEKIEGTHYVTMNESERNVYETIRKRVELKFKKGKTRDEKNIASQIDVTYFEELTKLRLASCDMHLLYDRWKYQSTKIKSLMEILDVLLGVPDNNILVFSQFTSFLGRIKPELEKRGWSYHYLDGQTPMKKRQTMVEEFQNGNKRLFLSSLKAGGLGINLTQANYVILLDPWWNPAIESQATDRAHRIGQQRCVSVIRLITQHTIEEKIMRLHEKKQSMSDDILDGTAESFKLSYDDILEMVTSY